MSAQIVTYSRHKRADLERFRDQALSEGNESLTHKKFDPDTLNGSIWMAYKDGIVVSISAAEVSHYTGETDVIRKCRYHILKKYRHGRYGFIFLKSMVPWCEENGYKLLYWTHDVNNVALNALYQRKRAYGFGGDNFYFHEWPYTKLQFQRSMLFRTGSMLQFVYSIHIDDSFHWRPLPGEHIYYFPHNGRQVSLADILRKPDEEDSMWQHFSKL